MPQYTFTFTEDYPLLESMARHPKAYTRMAEDHHPAPSEFNLGAVPNAVFLLGKADGNPVGFWMFEVRPAGTVELHTCFHPSAWGKTAHEAVLEMLKWIWVNTTWTELITKVPRVNRLALAFARHMGMAEEGLFPLSFRKHGELHDQILFGLKRPSAKAEEVTPRDL